MGSPVDEVESSGEPELVEVVGSPVLPEVVVSSGRGSVVDPVELDEFPSKSEELESNPEDPLEEDPEVP